MKIRIGAGALAFALLVSGCGEGESDLQTAAAAETAPLEQVAPPAGQQWTDMIRRTEEGGVAVGNPDAPVTLVEYASFTCPHCARFAEEGTDEILNEYVASGQVQFEFRNLVSGPHDAAATLLARCQPDGAFFRIADQLFAQQQQWIGNLDEQEAQRIQAMPEDQMVPALARAMELDTFMARRGMPEARFEECLTDRERLLELAEQTRTASEEHNLLGTPSFLINGELVQATTWEELEPRLRAAIRS